MTNEEFQTLVLQQFQAITHELKNLNQQVGNIETDVFSLKSDVTDLKKGQLHLETRMENEVIEKVRGLYEFREVQTDVNERILATLDRIEAKIETHDIQISILDRTKSNKRKTK